MISNWFKKIYDFILQKDTFNYKEFEHVKFVWYEGSVETAEVRLNIERNLLKEMTKFIRFTDTKTIRIFNYWNTPCYVIKAAKATQSDFSNLMKRLESPVNFQKVKSIGWDKPENDRMFGSDYFIRAEGPTISMVFQALVDDVSKGTFHGLNNYPLLVEKHVFEGHLDLLEIYENVE